MFELLGIKPETKVSMSVDDSDTKHVSIQIQGNELGKLIGFKGTTLNAFQLIFSQMLANELGESVPVLIDINEYRQRRENYLKSLALRAVKEAKENKQDVELPPLSSYERRIVHLAVQDEDGVTTESMGEGSERHVVIKVNK
jgi:spoIIIJ-associated protein